MDIRIRPFEHSDHDANARAYSNAFPDFPVSCQRQPAGRRESEKPHKCCGRVRYVGLSYLQTMDGHPDTLEVGLTGVRREHRRQGIAAALKFHTLSYAKEHGFRAIETGSDSANEAILAAGSTRGCSLDGLPVGRQGGEGLGRAGPSWVKVASLGLRGAAGGLDDGALGVTRLWKAQRYINPTSPAEVRHRRRAGRRTQVHSSMNAPFGVASWRLWPARRICSMLGR